MEEQKNMSEEEKFLPKNKEVKLLEAHHSKIVPIIVVITSLFLIALSAYFIFINFKSCDQGGSKPGG